MQLRIGLAHPVVWRTPRDLQVGIESGAPVLDGVSDADRAFIASLEVGVPTTSILSTARALGVDAARAMHIVRTLECTFDDRPPVFGGLSLAVVGELACASLVRSAVAAHGGTLARETNADLAVVVGGFRIPTADYREWLRSEVPFIAVTFTAMGAEIAPVLRAGRDACPRCADQERLAVDSAWGVLAAQLINRTPAGATAAVTLAAASATTSLLIDIAQGRQVSAITIDERGTQRVSALRRPHPECGCAVLRESGMPRGARNPATTTSREIRAIA